MQQEEMIPTEEFCLRHQVEITFIRKLESYGLAETITIEQTSYLPLSSIDRLEQAVRLHADLGINPEGIDAIGHLLKKMETLRSEISHLRRKLDFYEND